MENQTNIQITIPKPCHEDRNKMTPNEKGSFCSKCAKTVIDFTQKTNEEIKDFLTEQSGKKVCGRFMNHQLDQPLKSIDIFIPLYLLPKKLSFNKAFVLAIFISFGTNLFSCSSQKGEVVGKIAPAIDTTVSLTPDLEMNTIGDMTYTGSVITKEKPKLIKCSEIKGDVAIENIQGEIAMPTDTLIKTEDTLQKKKFKTGKIKRSK